MRDEQRLAYEKLMQVQLDRLQRKRIEYVQASYEALGLNGIPKAEDISRNFEYYEWIICQFMRMPDKVRKDTVDSWNRMSESMVCEPLVVIGADEAEKMKEGLDAFFQGVPDMQPKDNRAFYNKIPQKRRKKRM